jgi:AcrR family transcriptional regulator
MSGAARQSYHHGELRAALIKSADEIIGELGIEGFSLREAARRAGVSPGAPAHHFGSMAGLLTAVAARVCGDLEAYMTRVSTSGDPATDLRAFTTAYVNFAIDQPGRFRLICRNDLVDHNDPDYYAASLRAMLPLVSAAAEYHGTSLPPPEGESIHPGVLSAMASAHGIAHLTLEDKWFFALDPVDPKGDFIQRLLPGLLRSTWPDRARGMSVVEALDQPVGSRGVGGPQKSRIDKRIVQSRAALRGALLKLLTQHRLPEISAAMIAEQAGVGYATFFRHYADAEALALELAEEATSEVYQATLPAYAARDFHGALNTLADHVHHNRATVRTLLVSAGPAIQEAVTEQAINRISTLPETLGVNVPPELAIRYIVAGSVVILKWWLDKAPETPPIRIADLLYQLVVQSMVE